MREYTNTTGFNYSYPATRALRTVVVDFGGAVMTWTGDEAEWEFQANYWHSIGADYEIVSDEPYFARSYSHGDLLTRHAVHKAAAEKAEANELWQRYIGWKTVCTAAAAAEPLFG